MRALTSWHKTIDTISKPVFFIDAVIRAAVHEVELLDAKKPAHVKG